LHRCRCLEGARRGFAQIAGADVVVDGALVRDERRRVDVEDLDPDGLGGVAVVVVVIGVVADDVG
jgi:hypothetical protein